MNFDTAFDKLLGHEGGLSNEPDDPGGLTRYGISHAAYPTEDIANLTLERAKTLAKRDYWGPAGCDVVPDAVRYPLFDLAYNSGVGRAVRLLQRTVGETEDGIIGPRTLQAINSMDPVRLAARLHGHRLMFLSETKLWPKFGRGWTRRVAAELIAT